MTQYGKCRIVIASFAMLALAFAVAEAAMAQTAVPAASGSPGPVVAAAIGFDKLKGTWVRPDGGYRIVIGSVGADGRIEATYFNPNQLPFAKAQASIDGAQLRASFELRAGGYDGSTYELTYDPGSDRLKGVYFQAVIKQKFDVHFVRR